MKEQGVTQRPGPNSMATNEGGFTDLLGGSRAVAFNEFGLRSPWWSATEGLTDPYFCQLLQKWQFQFA